MILWFLMEEKSCRLSETLNLVSNAVKFSQPESTVDILLEDSGDTIIIGVKDYGVGIPEDELKKSLKNQEEEL